tara:strand:- start:704 stop:1606 length:903 start_codon:yes stop_codon:yes gene_type:complete
MSDELKKLIVNSINQTPEEAVADKKKTSKSAVEELRLYGGATRVVTLDNFKHHDKMKWRIRLDVFQWTNRDIALYITEKYYRKYQNNWDVSIVGVATHADRIKKCLFDILGFCDNVVIKDYLDYFFSYWADLYVQGANKTLRFKSFLSSDPIDEFVDSYNYSERVQHYISGMDSDYEGNLPKVDINKIDMSYRLGIDNLILDFGVIVAMNYLLKRGKELHMAIKLVSDAVVRICKDSDCSLVSEITNAYSPYSDKMIYKNSDEISSLVQSRIGREIPFNITFLDNVSRWEYFEHECNNEK